MSRLIKKVLIFLFGSIYLFVALAGSAQADGMVMPPPSHWVYQSDQKAVIYHQGNTETMVISIKFRGDAEDFAWIVPVPSRPVVDKAREDLFENLDELTKASDYRIMALGGKFSSESADASVIVWETKKIDIYEIAVLSSTNSGALREWLTKNGYQYPSDYEYLLREYIEDNWFFVAVKVDTSIEPSIAEQKLKSGHAAPLKFTFTTSQPIYPMRISAVTYTPRPTPTPTPTPSPTPVPELTVMPTPALNIIPTDITETYNIPDSLRIAPILPQPYSSLSVTLYVFTDRKMKASGYTTHYAGQVLPKTIRELSVDRSGDPWIDAQEKMYLTKLYRNYQISSISDDVVFLPADDNEPIGGGKKWAIETWKLWTLILFPLVVELAILGAIGLTEIKAWKKVTKNESEATGK
ncbi:DUF2330 domain-containing protein [Patescibacteria group bacterium]|nr:DUF2330 domain-containing protein [Patescibacteria group bacterium]